MRGAIRRAALWLSLIVIVPVASEFFIELAREQGLYEQPTAKAAAVLGVLQAITGHPVFPWIAGGILGFTIGVWLDTFLRRRETGRPIEPILEGNLRKPLPSSAQRDAVLVERLKPWANGHANLHLDMAAPIHTPLAERLNAVFVLAGWEVNYNKIPQEQWVRHYWGGIRVSGPNRVLLDSVAAALEEYGLPITKEPTEHKILKTNPKWAHAEHRVNVRIGHH